jgi:succinate dehydrogenase/fumarate reductase cytochrome b subunit
MNELLRVRFLCHNHTMIYKMLHRLAQCVLILFTFVLSQNISNAQQHATLAQKKITLNELIKLEEPPRIQVLLAVTTMILAKEVDNLTDDDDEKEREERE